MKEIGRMIEIESRLLLNILNDPTDIESVKRLDRLHSQREDDRFSVQIEERILRDDEQMNKKGNE
jgi:hypothetical protein